MKPNSKMTKILELAHEDFDVVIIILLKEIIGNMLTMNEKMRNLLKMEIIKNLNYRNKNYKS